MNGFRIHAIFFQDYHLCNKEIDKTNTKVVMANLHFVSHHDLIRKD